MMDSNTRRVLNRITANIPKHLREGLVKQVVDKSGEAMARDAMKGADSRTKGKLNFLIKQGAFRTSEDVVDSKKTSELERYHETKIQQAIKSGELKSPENDKWYQKRLERMKHHGGTQGS